MTPNEIYRKAIERYGAYNQRLMAIEECAELTNALAKYPRNRSTTDDIIEEIADMTIMCRQLALMFGEKEVETQISYKTI